MGETMNMTNWHICVVIPAHNEEQLLSRCLHSILIAKTKLPIYHTVDIVLAVDASTDKTKDIGSNILRTHGAVLTLNQRNVGLARRLATKLALQRYGGDLTRCWLANTDADCEVPTTWLMDQLDLAMKGIQGITGIVEVDSYKAHHLSVEARFLATYTINPDGTHPHIHGANIGIRADAYQRAGGWNGIETAEDHDLWRRLSLLNVPLLANANLSVLTSGRRIGRAPHGFAGTLAAFNEGLV